MKTRRGEEKFHAELRGPSAEAPSLQTGENPKTGSCFGIAELKGRGSGGLDKRGGGAIAPQMGHIVILEGEGRRGRGTCSELSGGGKTGKAVRGEPGRIPPRPDSRGEVNDR